MNDETFPSWEDLADLSSGGQAAELRKVLLDSTHPEYNEKWDEILCSIIAEEVYQEAIHALPFLVTAALHGDDAVQHRAIYDLVHIAKDADFSLEMLQANEKVRLFYDPHQMLPELQKAFHDLESLVPTDLGPHLYCLGVWSRAIPHGDPEFLQRCPQAASEFVACQLLYDPVSADGFLRLLALVEDSDLHHLIHLCFLEPMLHRDLTAQHVLDALEILNRQRFKDGPFVKDLMVQMAIDLEHLLESWLPPEVVLDAMEQRNFSRQERVHEVVLYRLVIQDLVLDSPNHVEVLFNHQGKVSEFLYDLQVLTGDDDFGLAPLSIKLSAATWKLLLDSDGVLSEFWTDLFQIYHDSDELKHILNASSEWS